nr:PREDICTED: solute carrier organic anion transporter family member 4A1 [Paralichthys olivaceus]
MPILLNADASFSSRQELLDLKECPVSGGPSLDTPSPVDSKTGSPTVAHGPIQPDIFTGASTVPGQLYGVEATPFTEAPVGLKLSSTDVDQLCGWGAVTPKFIQVFNTSRWVLFFLCAASFLQGMIVNGLINTVITTIEKRYDLHSYQSGLIASSYDIAACICLAFVSYFGGTGHKPRWLGWGVLIMAMGSLVFSLPYFTTPLYEVSVPQQTGMCSANRTSPCQDEQGGGLSNYRFVFMLSQFLHGVGATPLYTLGVTYLDENVQSNYAPVYMGIFYTASILGPAAGYLLGGYFLKIYTEIHLMDQQLLLKQRTVCLLSGSQKYMAMRVSEAHQIKDGSHSRASDPQFGKSVKDMPRSVLLLLMNPTFLFLCLAGATEAIIITGMSTFSPKYLESQFNLSASEAASLFGYMVVPAGGGGTFLGGYIVKRLKLRCRGIINFCIMCTALSLLTVFIFLIHCPNMPMAGVNAPYHVDLMEQHQLDQFKPNKLPHSNSSSIEETLIVGCNADCGCVRELYNPVCGANDVMYYSPCHAGCNSINHTQHSTGRVVYSGCSCVVGNVSWGKAGFALAGKCGSSCHHMPVLLAFLFFIIFFTFLCSIPALTATLRCVPDNQRSFALGIQWIVMRVFGSIPGPILFGSVIDISCLLWQNQCGERGSCYLYQNSEMSHYILGAGIICKILGTIFFLLANVMYQPPPESPQSNCEDSSNRAADTSDQPIKDLPEDGVIVNLHTRL